MMKHEFCEKAKIPMEALSDEDYEVIEFVYMYHPSIGDYNGKDQIATILKLPGGMRIIRDMVGTAKQVEEIEKQISAARRQMYDLEKKIDELIEAKKKL